MQVLKLESSPFGITLVCEAYDLRVSVNLRMYIALVTN